MRTDRVEDPVLGVTANDKDNAVVRRASGLSPAHPLVEGGLVDLCVS